MKLKGIIALALICFGLNTQAQDKKKFEEVKIQTSAVCDMCKKTIEDALLYTKGVKNASVDVPTAIATVKYRPDKTDTDKIRSAITAVGYKADDQNPTKEAFDALHECCKAPHD